MELRNLEYHDHEGEYLVSSYDWGSVRYSVVVTTRVPEALILEFAYKIETRFDCGGKYVMEIAINGMNIDLGDMGRRVVVPAGRPFGDEIRIPFTFRTQAGRNEFVFQWRGKDNQFWAGRYGTRFKDPIFRSRREPWDRRRELILLRESLSRPNSGDRGLLSFRGCFSRSHSMVKVFQNFDVFRYIAGYL